MQIAEKKYKLTPETIQLMERDDCSKKNKQRNIEKSENKQENAYDNIRKYEKET